MVSADFDDQMFFETRTTHGVPLSALHLGEVGSVAESESFAGSLLSAVSVSVTVSPESGISLKTEKISIFQIDKRKVEIILAAVNLLFF